MDYNKTVADKYTEYNFKYLSLIEFSDLIQICEDKDFLINMDILKDKNPTKYLEKLRKYQKQIEDRQLKQTSYQSSSQSANIPKCPTCGSTNIKKISGSKRWLSVGTVGLASGSIGKSMECKNCGYKF